MKRIYQHTFLSEGHVVQHLIKKSDTTHFFNNVKIFFTIARMLCHTITEAWSQLVKYMKNSLKAWYSVNALYKTSALKMPLLFRVATKGDSVNSKNL